MSNESMSNEPMTNGPKTNEFELDSLLKKMADDHQPELPSPGLIWWRAQILKKQGQNFGGGTLGLRQIAFRITEIGKAFLQVQRNGVIDFRTHAAFFQKLTQLVPLLHAYHILMKDVMGLRTGLEQHHRGG